MRFFQLYSSPRSMEKFMSQLWNRSIFLISIFFVLLALLYSWATPPLEASDEREHVGVVQYFVRTGQLPVQNPDIPKDDTFYEQEGSQPPLYYLLAAVLALPFADPAFSDEAFVAAMAKNPHALSGIALAQGNKNRLLPDVDGPTDALVYGLRLFSIALGLLTIHAVYRAGQLLAPDRPAVALLAAGSVAFNPMFIFIAASVNNDNLVIALNSIGIVLILTLIRDGFTVRRSVALALIVALASLTKLSGLVLGPVAALAGFIVVWRTRDWHGLLTLAVAGVGLWLIVAGWWYLRNVQLYGELFGTHTMVLVAGPRSEPFTLATALAEFEGFRIAYWGLFGAVNILTVPAFYPLMDALVLLGFIGLPLAIIHMDATHRVQSALMGLVLLIGSVAFLTWTAQTYASQGRLLFPYVAAAHPLMALGWAAWLRPAWTRRIVALPLVALGVFAALVPFMSIAPAYVPPPALNHLPSSAMPVYARFGDVVLIGYETPDDRYAPGDELPITVYWQVIAPTDDDLSLFLHAIAPDGREFGKVDSYPGGGTLRTSTWQAGAIYADSYHIPLDVEMQGAFPLRVQVGWWHYPTQTRISAVDIDGRDLGTVTVNTGGFAAPLMLNDLPERVIGVDFGGLIALRGLDLVSGQLRLEWEALAAIPENFTVFVQALDAADTIIAQADAAPDLPTRYWRTGERFITAHPLGDWSGATRIILGWYRPVDFSRLALNTGGDAYTLPLTAP